MVIGRWHDWGDFVSSKTLLKTVNMAMFAYLYFFVFSRNLRFNHAPELTLHELAIAVQQKRKKLSKKKATYRYGETYINFIQTRTVP
ncbi:hypothetical protein NIES208_10695 [[Limnothrix rosea] IAM M-220]|nr:hypothetical protein NIES208_10695 [[Limnothrix rosea] IAM M-220]